MPIRRVAIIFDSVQRPETTGVYCHRALSRLVEVQHFQPHELDRIPRAGIDLYINIDDGLRYRLPADLRPCAWWAIDTHLDFSRCLEKSRTFDLVFAAQRDGVEDLRRAGIASAAWLPLACDPDVHARHEVAKQYDVAFVGNLFPGPRVDLLELIRRRHHRTFIGQCYFDEMARTYSAARTVFNRSIANDVNMRVFEAVSCGSMLLTNDLSDNGQAELFRDGVHLAVYREAEDLLDKLAFYLARESLREKIAASGRAEALEKHTYAHRMERLLRDAGSRLPTVVGLTQPAGAAARSIVAVPAAADPFYFGHVRPELMALVPESARAILDIGCGTGKLGEALKARQRAEVVGIELNESAAALARQRIDEVFAGDVERLDLPFSAGRFDAIVCGDILEHLRDPARLLRQARAWLAPDGRLAASIPNVRHHSVIRSLLEGNWTYESAGLLDQTHLRFFTRREIEKLFFRSGFAIDELRSVFAPDDRGAMYGVDGQVRLGKLCINGLSDKDSVDYHTYQYLVRSRPIEFPDRGLTSIVIATHNQLEYTRQCLDSLRRLTDEPCELIVVDNGSSDGTVEYLRTFPDVRLIVNETNRGFPAAVNQGIGISNGAQILLLNNDTVLTTGWLCRLLRALHSDPAIGLVGPCSNYVSGPQRIDVGYDSLADLDGFAWDWGGAHDGVRIDVNRLVGFCLLIRRAVVDSIGLFDEQFGVGCFEDDDYCLRAIHAGYRAVIAADAFVHHFGGRTFLGCGVDFSGVMRENERRFRAKWPGSGEGTGTVNRPAGAPVIEGHSANGADAKINGPGVIPFDAHSLKHPPTLEPSQPEPPDAIGMPEPSRRSPGPFAVDIAPGGGLRLRREMDRPRLSLCMIVRDSARTLPACLGSIRPWVDEMVIVDTGSVDETPRIVESFGGRLFHFPWCDDFSAARNESLRHARGDWIFWMDSDDTIPPECGRLLRELIDRAVDPALLGFIMQVHCPSAGEDGDAMCDATVVDHAKLFRNRPDLRFDGRIHEQILAAIRRAGGTLAWTEVYVVHSGSEHSAAAQERKLKRDLRLLELELAERPEHPFTLFNFGMTYAHASRFAEAADHLRRSIAASGAADSHLRKAHALLVYAELSLGHRERALETCRRGRELFPLDAELRFREGVLLHDQGRFEEARRAYLGALDSREERHFSSIVRGITGFKARQNLAVLAAELGDLAEAERQWREVVREAPGYRPGWRGLGDTLIRLGRLDDAGVLADGLTNDQELRIEGTLLKHRVALARGLLAEARAEIDLAAALHPDDLDGLQRRCQFLFEHGSPDDAEAALRGLIARQPQDPSAHYNLGTVLFRCGRLDEAEQTFRQSLRYRSNHAGTYLHLGYALKETGRTAEAAAAWQQVLRLSPGHPAASDELRRLGYSI